MSMLAWAGLAELQSLDHFSSVFITSWLTFHRVPSLRWRCHVNEHCMSVAFCTPLSFCKLHVQAFLVLSSLLFRGINCFVWHEMIHQYAARAVNPEHFTLVWERVCVFYLSSFFFFKERMNTTATPAETKCLFYRREPTGFMLIIIPGFFWFFWGGGSHGV